MLLGYKVMETVGKKVVAVDYPKGFAVQFVTAACINLGTIFKLPLSATHCVVGALLGVGLANKLSVVKRVYNLDDEKKKEMTEEDR